MIRKHRSKSVLLVAEFSSFRQQETIFIVLNLFILATLLLVHTLFASYWGYPSALLVTVLAAALFAQGGELFWLTSRTTHLEVRGMTLLSWTSITFNILLAVILSAITNREDTQYFVIMTVPILVAAFRLNLFSLLAVLTTIDGTNAFWVWHYAQHRIPIPVNEYVETGTVSLIYTVVGLLVWLLVNLLHQKEERLSQSLVDLEKTRERLVQEEKLAAVGRLASGIAHEIRNPVSTIVSALLTARGDGLEPSEREEMFTIASKESQRLEKLTTDFLAYARPCNLQRAPACVDDTLGYVADVCRPRGNERGVAVCVLPSGGLMASMDAGRIQQALVDLVLNALEASPSGGRVELRAAADREGSVRIEVENTGPCIPATSVRQIFEPFFTTKPRGTGLGLAIARNIACAHNGELALSVNEPGRVCFTLTIPAAKENGDAEPA